MGTYKPVLQHKCRHFGVRNMALRSIFYWIIPLALFHFVKTEFAIYECPGGWVEFSANCYKFEKDPEVNREGMKARCNYDGAAGLSINSDEEHKFIQAELDRQDSGQQKHDWWTSGRRVSQSSSKFYWEGDGNPVESFVYWHNSSIPLDTSKSYIMYHFNGHQWAWILGTGDELKPVICEISKSEIYKIRTEERGPGYGNPNPDPEAWETGPYFTVQPVPTVFEIESPQTFVALDCVASGLPPPTYRWFKERAGQEVEILPESDPRYTFINGRLVIDQPTQDRNDDGNYQCRTQNKFGSIMSVTAPLNFGYLHDFPKSPRSPVSAAAHSWASVECNPPAHFPAILYAWYRNDVYNFIRPELKPHTFISNDGRLYFSEVTTDDVGNYYCMVYKPGSGTGAGKVSMPTELRVVEGSPAIYEPVIGSGFPLVYPNAPKVGDRVRLECWAHGTCRPPQFLLYSWDKYEIYYVNGEPRERILQLPQQSQLIDHNRVLVIDNIQNYDSGTYRCHVRRPNGQSTSKDVQVILNAIPYFILDLADQYPDVGSDLRWRCQANGYPAVTYRWYKNSQLFTQASLPPEDRDRITIQQNVITIRQLNIERDSAMYQCAASNVHGTSYSTAQLKVMSLKPSFAKRPLQPNQFATLQGNTTIMCRPEAAPTPTITWFKNNIPLNPGVDPNSRIRQMPNGHLFISNIMYSDQGTYKCVAENLHGQANSSGNLTILSQTTVSWPPESVGVDINKTAYMNCIASYSPQLDVTYIWYHNNMLIEFEKIFRLGENRYQVWRHPHFVRGRGWYQGGLYIVRAQTEHQGRYTCMVESPVDSYSRFGDLIVTGPPSMPAGVNIQENSVTHTSVVVQWKRPESNGPPIMYYVVEGYNHWEKLWRVLKTNIVAVEDDTQTMRTNVTNLRPNSHYHLRMRAENRIGTSQPSQTTRQFTTSPLKPDLYPQQVGGGGGKTGDLQVTWKPLEPWQHNAGGLHYMVYAKNTGDEEWDWVQRSIEPGRHVFLVGEQNFYRQYDVAVQAVNSVGPGPMSPTVTIRSAMALPTVIAQNVRAQPFNSTACLVHWEPVPDNRETVRGKLGGYRLSYWKEVGETEAMAPRVTINGQASEGLVIALDPDTPYYFDVMVWNDAGNGPKSQWFIQRTLRQAPINQPVEVQVERMSSYAIQASWRGVSTNQLEEPLTGYKVKIWREGQHIKSATDYDAGKETDLYIDGLRHDIIYKLRVFGYSRGGDGTQSSPTVKFILGSGSLAQVSQILVFLSLMLTSWFLW